MASTYVNDLRLNEMATGDESGNWGVVTNLNLELVGEALGYGTEGITTNADTHTTTIADGTTVSATGIVGQQYTITNSISANQGFEFTVPASWSSGGTGTVTGTFVSGTTEINQNVTGTVVAETSVTQFLTSLNSEASSASSCSIADTSARRFHSGSGTYPTTGDVIYTTSAATTLFNGNNGWYYVGGDLSSIKIGTNGLVTDYASC